MTHSQERLFHLHCIMLPMPALGNQMQRFSTAERAAFTCGESPKS